MRNNFRIYDASAGSGKTFNLASNYIVTAMIYGFKNILAVTFTNAAAKEMKDRIMEVLKNIASNRQDNNTLGYKKYIVRLYKEKSGISINDIQIQKMCASILKQILHNYSFFNISTIDSFFQIVLKNLTKELGIKGNYILALEEKKYNELAVKSLINRSNEKETNNQRILTWLTNFFVKNVEDGKLWNIEKNLNQFVHEAFKSEITSTFLNSDNEELLSINKLEELRNSLAKEIKQFENTLIEKRNKFIFKCKELGLSAKDFKDGRKNGIYNYVEKLPTDIPLIKELEERKCLKEVYPEYDDIINYLHDNYNDYLLNKIYYDNIYQLGVLNTISQIKNEILKKENIFVLHNTAFFLNKLNEGDVPFVFEKISQRIEHIFIDEFQDTNRSSFNNLRRLIEESLQSNGSSYIFGDIKQSIYRWSGGDMHIMQQIVSENRDNVHSLMENFRSLGNIVNFNNDFFGRIYKQNNIEFVPQEIRRDDNIGIVRIQFVNQDKKSVDKGVDIFDYIKQEIDYYHREKGYDLSDIALLFRSNKKLVATANRLKNDTSFDYNPVSDIAFKFSSSLAVNKIIEALRYINDNKKVISKEIINGDSSAINEIDMLAKTYKREKSLLEIVMKIASILHVDNDAVFLPAFYDTIKDYIKTRIGGLSEFIQYWDESLQDKSVDMSGVKAGIRLTSIHKSKGLAYKVVIVPYCDNPFYKSTNIWINKVDKSAKLPIFMTSSSKLEQTSYNNLFEEEKYAQLLDSINLLYVAFTRSQDNLSIISSFPSVNALKSEPKSANTLLYRYVTQIQPQDFANKGGSLFIYKNCEKTKEQIKQTNNDNAEEIIVNKIHLTDNSISFSTAREEDMEQYFASSYNDLTQQEKGSKYHEYVARLIMSKDIDRLVLQAKLGGEQADELNNIFVTLVSQTKDLHWFDGSYKILNERSIIYLNLANEAIVKRPDRVMFNDREVIIVDYKFGNKEKRYKKQVHEYMELISKMKVFQNKTIKGFLYYIDIDNPDNNEIEEC